MAKPGPYFWHITNDRKWRVSAIAGRNDRDEIEYVIDNGVTRAIHFRSGRTLFNVQATIQQLVGSLNGKCIPPIPILFD